MAINGSYSPVMSGVPQGSVVDSLLFTIYVNDVYSVIHHPKHGMFAGDQRVCALSDCELLQKDLRMILLDFSNGSFN